MSATEHVQQPTSHVVYPLSPKARRMFFIWGGTSAFAVLLLIVVNLSYPMPIGQEPLLFLISWILPLWFILVTLYCFAQAFQQQLTLSPEGVEFQMPGSRVTTEWDNVDRVVKLGRENGILRLKNPVAATGSLPWLAKFHRTNRTIPLGGFGQWWGDGALAQDLKRYAPHLF